MVPHHALRPSATSLRGFSVPAYAASRQTCSLSRRQRRRRQGVVCGVVVGIDLGTSNSAVALIRDGRATVLPDQESGSCMTPSVVAYDATGRALVGAAAAAQAATNPLNTFYSVKRIIGRPASEIAQDAARLVYTAGDDGSGAAAVYCPAMDAWLPPERVSSDLLAALVQRAAEYAGDDVSSAVITVPAHFGPARRAATLRAARAAGLHDVQLLQEPVAAALAYGAAAQEGNVLVFDLGGGTFDVSLLASFEGILEVLASDGDSWLGGDDWDAALLAWVLDDALPPAAAQAIRAHPEALQQLTSAVQSAKVALSGADAARITLPGVAPGLDVDVPLTREQAEAVTAPLLARLAAPLDTVARETFLEWAESPAQALAGSSNGSGNGSGDSSGGSGGARDGAPPAQARDKYAPPPRRASQLVLVGGASRTPAVRAFASRITGLTPASGVDAELCVALGAAVQAGLLTGELSGLEVMDGGYDVGAHDRASGFVGTAR